MEKRSKIKLLTIIEKAMRLKYIYRIKFEDSNNQLLYTMYVDFSALHEYRHIPQE